MTTPYINSWRRRIHLHSALGRTAVPVSLSRLLTSNTNPPIHPSIHLPYRTIATARLKLEHDFDIYVGRYMM